MHYAAGVEYDGTDYCGWQSQPGMPTVQAAIESALGKVAGIDDPLPVMCAGRTDTGVHALNQVIHFETPAERDEKAWVFGANTVRAYITSITPVDWWWICFGLGLLILLVAYIAVRLVAIRTGIVRDWVRAPKRPAGASSTARGRWRLRRRWRRSFDQAADWSIGASTSLLNASMLRGGRPSTFSTSSVTMSPQS